MSIIIDSAGESNYIAPNVIIAALKVLLNFVVKPSDKKIHEKSHSKEVNPTSNATTTQPITNTNNENNKVNNTNNSPNFNVNESERETIPSASLLR
jgi:hypothetical protein